MGRESAVQAETKSQAGGEKTAGQLGGESAEADGMFAHEIGGPIELSNRIIEGVRAAIRDGRIGGTDQITLDGCLHVSGIEASDAADMELCERAMQRLRRRKLVTWMKDTRAWLFYFQR